MSGYIEVETGFGLAGGYFELFKPPAFGHKARFMSSGRLTAAEATQYFVAQHVGLALVDAAKFVEHLSIDHRRQVVLGPQNVLLAWVHLSTRLEGRPLGPSQI